MVWPTWDTTPLCQRGEAPVRGATGGATVWVQLVWRQANWRHSANIGHSLNMRSLLSRWEHHAVYSNVCLGRGAGAPVQPC